MLNYEFFSTHDNRIFIMGVAIIWFHSIILLLWLVNILGYKHLYIYIYFF